jgi:hypothetical protein
VTLYNLHFNHRAVTFEDLEQQVSDPDQAYWSYVQLTAQRAGERLISMYKRAGLESPQVFLVWTDRHGNNHRKLIPSW